MEIKSSIFIYTLGFIAAVEPLALPWILLGSFLFGLIGGTASARMQKVSNVPDIMTHAVSMAMFGCSVSMVGYWYFAEKDPNAGYMLVGFAGLCALVGTPLFQPLGKLATSVIEAIAEAIIEGIKRMTGKQ